MTDSIYVHLDDQPTVPSFRVERGEVKSVFDPDFVFVNVMHPYDIVQKLAEAGNINQAFAALDGFLRREIDIKTQTAIDRIYRD
jgi:hypothetical protein